jgi:thiamine biosynthesis lipoprotein
VIAAPTLTTDRFRAMNTDVTVSLALEGTASYTAPIQEIRSWFAYTEKVFSRFRTDSELSGLNAAAGQPVKISRTMEEVLEWARHYQHLSGGMFDPGILPSLIRAGYAISYERLLGPDRDASFRKDASPAGQEQQPGHWLLFGPLQTVRLDKDTRLDLGGIVKGWAVDRITDRLLKQAIPAGIVNAGGDLRVWGNSASPAWNIEISDPRQPALTLAVVSLRGGAIATSSVLGRKWETVRGLQHHLIDPRTGHPSESDILQCTVVGRRTAKSEVAAKTFCLLGSRDGANWLRRQCPESDALFLTRDGELTLMQGWASGAVWRKKGE